MDYLMAELSDSLNPYVIGLLNQRNIYTIQEFLCTDPIKLMSITNIGMQIDKYSDETKFVLIE